MKRRFEDYLKDLTPKLKGIAHKLNGHFTYFDDDDLFQEAVAHLWVLSRTGGLRDKTDSYILQGCYFHLKNYIRVTMDKTDMVSLNAFVDEEETSLEDTLSTENSGLSVYADDKLLEDAIQENGLMEREKEILLLSLKGLTTREIGKRLGVSHVMVIKLRNKARAKCRALQMEIKRGYQS